MILEPKRTSGGVRILWLLSLAGIALAGCTTPAGDPGPTDPPAPTATSTTTDAPPYRPTLAACDADATYAMYVAYDAAGGGATSHVAVVIDGDGVWIADLQDESDHEHIVATGEGLFNLTAEDAEERLWPLLPSGVDADHPRFAILAWHAATPPQMGKALCEAFDGAAPDCFACDWTITRDGDDGQVTRPAADNTPLGQAFCELWRASNGIAVDPQPIGGHHGALCKGAAS